MRITIKRSELKDAITGLGKIISRHSSLPILQGIKFFTKDGLLNAVATDLDHTVCFSFEAEIEKAGAFVVNCEALKPFTKGKDEDRLIMEESGDSVVIINTVASHSITERLVKFDAQEWPADLPPVETKSVDSKFLDYFRKAVPFVSKDNSRQVLTTVHLDVSGNDHCIVATDGRRLTCFNSMAFPFKVDCNLSPTKFLTWSNLAGDIEIGAKKINGTVWFVLKNQRWVYQARSMDGIFPNWKQVVPSEPGAHIIIFAENDVQMLPKVFSWFAGNDHSNKPVTLVGKEGRLTIYGYNNENTTWSTLDLKESRYEGRSSLVTLDRDYLLDALQSGFRTITFADNRSPVCSDDGQGKHVLMPITPMVPDGIVVEDYIPAEVNNAQEETNTAEVQSEPETVNKKEKKTMPETIKTETVTTLDKVLLAYELARGKIKEAQSALSDIAAAIKDVARDEKNRKNELVTARETLARLQAIRI